jgi:sugar/nucleoside kinase (ribokinase family)
MRIGLVGQTAHDIVTTSAGDEERVGGSPHYGRRALAGLGVETVVVTHTGFTSRLDHRDGRTAQWIEAVGPPFTAAEVLAAAGGCEWILLGGQSAGDFPPEMIGELAGAGHRLLLDAQGLCRGPDAGRVHLRAFPPAAARGVEILKLAEREALAAAGSIEPWALRGLGAPEVAVTRAGAGALVVTAEHVFPIPPTGAGSYTDPTGAGDTWSAAYLAARASGAEPGEAGRTASSHTDSLYL